MKRDILNRQVANFIAAIIATICRRQRDRIGRCRNIGLGREQLHQSLRGARGAHQFAIHFAHRRHGIGDQHRIKQKRRELTARDAAFDDVVATDPENHANRAKGQHDHRRDQCGIETRLGNCGGKYRLDAIGETRTINRLVRVGLYGANFMQRFIKKSGRVGKTVGHFPGEFSHPPPQQQNRHQYKRNARHHQQGELGAGDQQHHHAAEKEHDITQRE